jgi:hypothetical protein
MKPALWIKLVTIVLVEWMAVDSVAMSGWVAAGLLALLALLDASAEDERLEKRDQRKERPLLAEAAGLMRGLFSRRVGPFYVALALLGWAGWSERQGDLERGRRGDSSSGLAASRGWAADAGGSHQPGKSGLCACGKPLGHDKGGAAPAAPDEAARRTETLKKRAMKSTPAGPSMSQLPGIGPNAKPLPPGLVPNANAKLPPGVKPVAPIVEPEIKATEPPKSESSAKPAAPTNPTSTTPGLPAGSGQSLESGAQKPELPTPSPMP